MPRYEGVLSVRIGVLSDLHCELEQSGSSWINTFAPEHLDAMIDAALAWFTEEETDLIILLGDIVQFPHTRDLEHAFARLAAGAGTPLAVVNGNHDLRLGEAFSTCARRHGISLLAEKPFAVSGIAVRGVELAPGPGASQYVGVADEPEGEPTLTVVASHFPLLSEAAALAAADIPYAGDLVNRAELESRFASDPRPTLVLSGHIHARCTTHSAKLLQFIVGALIEPPFDATIIEVDQAGPHVRRRARRLGETAVIDPVFAPDDESWQWTGRGWQTSAVQ